MTVLSKTEWKRRYVTEIVRLAGLDQSYAEAVAEAAMEAGAADDCETPEEAVAEELSCWDDDEGSSPD